MERDDQLMKNLINKLSIGVVIVDTRKKPDHWANTSSRITCKKDGCKN